MNNSRSISPKSARRHISEVEAKNNLNELINCAIYALQQSNFKLILPSVQDIVKV